MNGIMLSEAPQICDGFGYGALYKENTGGGRGIAYSESPMKALRAHRKANQSSQKGYNFINNINSQKEGEIETTDGHAPLAPSPGVVPASAPSSPTVCIAPQPPISRDTVQVHGHALKKSKFTWGCSCSICCYYA